MFNKLLNLIPYFREWSGSDDFVSFKPHQLTNLPAIKLAEYDENHVRVNLPW